MWLQKRDNFVLDCQFDNIVKRFFIQFVRKGEISLEWIQNLTVFVFIIQISGKRKLVLWTIF